MREIYTAYSTVGAQELLEQGYRVRRHSWNKNCYLENPTTLSGQETNNLYEGFKVNIPMEFVDVEGIELDVAKVSLFVVNVFPIPN